MSRFLDEALVGVLMLVSVVYALAALAPRNLRRRILSGLGAWLGRAPAALKLQTAARRLAAAAETKTTGACGGCDNCGSEKPASAAQIHATNEVKVPVDSIRRANSSRRDLRL